MIATLSNLSKFIKGVMQGRPWGDVEPPLPSPPGMHIDGRTAALRILRRYMSELTFFRSGDRITDATAEADEVYGPPVAFRVPEKNIHIEHPDNVDQMELPAIVVIPGQGTYESLGLGTVIDESTRDRFAPDTAVLLTSEYRETIQLEVWGAGKAERRAVIIGLETALTPTEFMAGVRFRMPAYFDQLVLFSLGGRRIVEEDAGRNRRRALLDVEMSLNVCSLVNVVDLKPIILTEVTDDPKAFVEVE